MISEKQLQANRSNALVSTGPKTASGKEKVAQNARKHGLLSKHVVINDESQAQFNRFRQELLDHLEPVGSLEEVLADRLAAAIWRLHRAGRIEVELLDTIYLNGISSASIKNPELPTLGKALRYDLINYNTLSKFHRYEAHIERGLFRTLHELQRLQAARKGQPVAAPAVLDIDVAGLREE